MFVQILSNLYFMRRTHLPLLLLLLFAWAGIHSVDWPQSPVDLPAPASRVMELSAGITMPP